MTALPSAPLRHWFARERGAGFHWRPGWKSRSGIGWGRAAARCVVGRRARAWSGNGGGGGVDSWPPSVSTWALPVPAPPSIRWGDEGLVSSSSSPPPPWLPRGGGRSSPGGGGGPRSSPFPPGGQSGRRVLRGRGVSRGTAHPWCLCPQDGRADVVANDAGDRVTPAVVAFSESEEVRLPFWGGGGEGGGARPGAHLVFVFLFSVQVVGLAAKQSRIRNISNTVVKVKQILGRR